MLQFKFIVVIIVLISNNNNNMLVEQTNYGIQFVLIMYGMFQNTIKIYVLDTLLFVPTFVDDDVFVAIEPNMTANSSKRVSLR